MNARNAIVGIVSLFLAGPVWAQTRTAAPRASADAPNAIAVIDIQRAIGTTEQGKQAALQYQSKFAPEIDELNKLTKQIQDIQQQMQNGQNTLSDEEKTRLSQQYQELTGDYSRKQQDLQADEQDARTDVLDDIGPKMLKVVNRYAADHGFNLVLDRSPQSSIVLYASNAVDITDAVIKLYDQSYPAAKPAATSPKPKP